MKIFNRGESPKSESRSIALTPLTASSTSSVFVQPWDTRNLPKGGPRETLTAAVIAAVAADVADIAHFPARVTELGTGRDLSEVDPLAYALNVSPRSGMTAAELRAHILFQLEYTGSCYLVLVGNTLTPLLAASVDILPAQPGQHNRDGSPAIIAGYVIKNQGGKELGRYTADGLPQSGSAEGQLIRIAHPYPGDPFRADAPVSRAGLAIDTLAYARQASAFALRNSGSPAGLVQITDPSVDNESITDFDRRLNSRLSDVSQRGRVLVVSSEVQYTGIDNSDPSVGISSLTEMARRDVLSVWSMPESRLGIGGGRTYENQRVETSNYLRNTVAHRLGLIASALNQIARARGVVVDFELNAPELGEQDTEVAARAEQLYTAGIISLDEARDLVGYGPTVNGERFNTPQPTPGAPARDTGPLARAVAETANRDFEADWTRGYAGLVDDIEEQLATAAQAFHAKTYREISRKLRSIAKAYDRAEDAPRVSVEQIYDAKAAETALLKTFEPLLDEAVARAGGFAFSQLNTGLTSLPRWEKLAARRLARLVKGVDSDGVEIGLGWSRQLAVDVGEALKAGYAAGESTGKIAARIANTLGVDTKSFKTIGDRALTIARTEANGLANETAMDAFQGSGVVEKKRWYTVGDNRTRESHLAVNGQEVALGDRFNVGGVSMVGPHDPSAPAGEVVNCRCRLIPVVNQLYV